MLFEINNRFLKQDFHSRNGRTDELLCVNTLEYPKIPQNSALVLRHYIVKELKDNICLLDGG